MSFIHDTRSVEQQRFFNGQRLFDSDLQGIEAFNREMRWLHNQSLHQPGIGNGFAVTGKKGDREVTVGPGYAIDDLGREIVLTSSRTLPVPPVAGDIDGKPKRYLLTVEYPEEVDLEVVEQRQGLCADQGATRQRVEPVFCWAPLTSNGLPENTSDAKGILSGRQLVLAEFAVRDCKLDKNLILTQRRNAKPTAQPYIACGEENPSAWQIRTLPGNGDGLNESHQYHLVAGIEAEIDTTSAGFLTEPQYFARLDGERIVTIGVELPHDGEFGNGEREVAAIFDGLVHIVNPTATGFTARVLVLFFGALEATQDGEVVEFRRISEPAVALVNAFRKLIDEVLSMWTIVWMGVEG